MTAHPELREVFDAAGIDGYFHAVDLAGGGEVAHHADEPVVTASTFKLPILVELCRRADAGELALTDRVTIPVEGRADGPTGLSAMRDPITISWRDLSYLMMSVSDNAATDVIAERVGLERVEAAMSELGLVRTRLPLDCRGIYAQMYDDLGVTSAAELPATITPEQLPSMASLDPERTCSTTPRDMTTLLAAVWHDAAASPRSCRLMREILAAQVWPHRLASGFPEDAITTAGKTGTLPSRRNEIGVVTWDDGATYAVAVFTVEPEAPWKRPATDAAIGRAARVAIDLLRGAIGTQ